MFSILNAILNWLVGLAVTYLPASPFVSLNVGGYATAIGWLNWFVPVQDLLGIFDAWLIGCAAWMLYKYLYKQMGGILSSFLGGQALGSASAE